MVVAVVLCLMCAGVIYIGYFVCFILELALSLLKNAPKHEGTNPNNPTNQRWSRALVITWCIRLGFMTLLIFFANGPIALVASLVYHLYCIGVRTIPFCSIHKNHSLILF